MLSPGCGMPLSGLRWRHNMPTPFIRGRSRVSPAKLDQLLASGTRLCVLAREFGMTSGGIVSIIKSYRERRDRGVVNDHTAVSEDDRQFIHANWRKMTDAEMGVCMGRTPQGVKIIRCKMQLFRRDFKNKKRNSAPLPNPPITMDPAARVIIANRLHLLDLKRAGYPYAFGEPGRPGP